MKSNALLLVVLLAMLCGCSKKDWKPVQAEIFITTESGQTLRLSNVPFAPMPQSSVREIMQINNDSQEKYAGQRADFESAIDKCVRLGAIADAKKLRDEYNRTRDYGLHNALLNEPWGYSDADGKVTLFSMNAQGVYWAAKAERTLANGEHEVYLWLEYVNAGSTKPIRFSNHNLWTVDTGAEKIGFHPCLKL